MQCLCPYISQVGHLEVQQSVLLLCYLPAFLFLRVSLHMLPAGKCMALLTNIGIYVQKTTKAPPEACT